MTGLTSEVSDAAKPNLLHRLVRWCFCFPILSKRYFK